MRPDPYAWSVHGEALLAVSLLVASYLYGTRRERVSRARLVCFWAGVALLVAAAVTPLDALSFHLLTAHLLQNVVLAEWAPALVVFGIPPGLARELGRLRVVSLLTRPAVALTVWLGTYFAWHLPWVYDAALRHPLTLLHLEHGLYFAAGCLLWWPVAQDSPHELEDGARALYLFAAFALASPLGLLLALVPTTVYDYYEDGGLWGLSPLTDQQIAGVTMAVEQAIVFFAAFSYFLARFLRAQEAETEP
ncbi:MAG: cytochrome c oxidase assembly protein [Solirubrobacterales bacterium]